MNVQRISGVMLAAAVLANAANLSAEPTVDTSTLRSEVDSALSRFEREWGDISQPDPRGTTLEEGENRAQRIIQAAEEIRFALPRADSRERTVWGYLTDDFNPSRALDHSASIETDLARFHKSTSLLEDLGELEYSSYGDMDGWNGLQLLDTSRLITAHALLSVARGQARDAISGLDKLFSIKESFASEPDSILQILRNGITRDALGVLRELLSNPVLSPKDLAELKVMVQRGAEYSAASQYLRSELIFHLFLIDEIEKDHRREIGEDPRVEKAALGLRLHWVDLTDRWMRFALTPPHLREGTPEYRPPEHQLVIQLENGSGSGPDESTDAEVAEAMTWIAAFSKSSWLQFITRCDVGDARLRLALAALSVEQYAADHGGALPGSLDQVVPGYLPVVPVDPFTGDALEYTRSENGYRLLASDPAMSSWDLEKRDPVLDWSRPRLVKTGTSPPASRWRSPAR